VVSQVPQVPSVQDDNTGIPAFSTALERIRHVDPLLPVVDPKVRSARAAR